MMMRPDGPVLYHINAYQCLDPSYQYTVQYWELGISRIRRQEPGKWNETTVESYAAKGNAPVQLKTHTTVHRCTVRWCNVYSRTCALIVLLRPVQVMLQEAVTGVLLRLATGSSEHRVLEIF